MNYQPGPTAPMADPTQPNLLPVLVVEDNPATRSEIRSGLEPEGVRLLEAGSVAQARDVLDEPFEAAIVEPRLPDGWADVLLPDLRDRLPDSRIVVYSAGDTIAGLRAIGREDLAGLAQMLGLGDPGPVSPVVGVARRNVGRVHRKWVELCRWDPALPPDDRPAMAEEMIRAVNGALERPQPLGWGLDPAIVPVAERFGRESGDVRRAVAELVCLKEAFASVVVAGLDEDRGPALHRLGMIVDRSVEAVVEAGFEQLLHQALTDELTGLANRWAFEEDLKAELVRRERVRLPLSLAMVDVDGLKRVNDTHGHAAGDQLLRRAAGAMKAALRRSDRAYRIGGDEFAIILLDSAFADAAELGRRLHLAGAPPISIGLASWPPDDLHSLVRRADERLYESRRRRQ